jgi:hypothetical protein
MWRANGPRRLRERREHSWARAIEALGSVIVGSTGVGTNPDGQPEAWIVRL